MSSAVVEVIPSRVFNSAAVAVTSVEPNLILLAVILPCISVSLLTVNLVASNNNKLPFEVWPIVELSITILSTVIFPACISPPVVIGLLPTLIEPKLDVIEPLSSAPVVTIVAPPLIGAYEALAVAVSNLASICGWIELVTPWT